MPIEDRISELTQAIQGLTVATVQHTEAFRKVQQNIETLKEAESAAAKGETPKVITPISGDAKMDVKGKHVTPAAPTPPPAPAETGVTLEALRDLGRQLITKGRLNDLKAAVAEFDKAESLTALDPKHYAAVETKLKGMIDETASL